MAEWASEITACGEDSAGELSGEIEQGGLLKSFDYHIGSLKLCKNI
jgi:hypothetical protein